MPYNILSIKYWASVPGRRLPPGTGFSVSPLEKFAGYSGTNSAILDLAAVISNKSVKADTQNAFTSGGYRPITVTQIALLYEAPRDKIQARLHILLAEFF